jgi:hypothetical protein
MEASWRVRGFAEPAKVRQLTSAISAHAHLLRPTSGPGHPPSLLDHRRGRDRRAPPGAPPIRRNARPAGRRGIRRRADRRPWAATRVPVFEGVHRELRWHFDAHHYAALPARERQPGRGPRDPPEAEPRPPSLPLPALLAAPGLLPRAVRADHDGARTSCSCGARRCCIGMWRGIRLGAAASSSGAIASREAGLTGCGAGSRRA